ncbi:hypothetical protein AVEN_157481-1 [Araneus ventricosus]|uniref:Uncharacterized protein n=1 Tax=Araneus ventricosus TaxID=182803 RepID=A0A4Y2NYG5_ARAVE|nr:hypothetical protein AVEN_238893-1 [Araneus ventricosus]GBN44654.1 hypothetical protein AVEN_248611-1 [Araneus ventricosus]GBN44685.1 hypothetical protein AVEN_44702-1 [Araneus ventricosus]GBN44740.1 hypothetical protein AVEN_157481-1 [Araneus ventricosus]
MTRATPELQHHTIRRTFARYASFSVQQAPYTKDLQWNRVSSLYPSSPEVGTLPLSHRGPVHDISKLGQASFQTLSTSFTSLTIILKDNNILNKHLKN